MNIVSCIGCVVLLIVIIGQFAIIDDLRYRQQVEKAQKEYYKAQMLQYIVKVVYLTGEEIDVPEYGEEVE